MRKLLKRSAVVLGSTIWVLMLGVVASTVVITALTPAPESSQIVAFVFGAASMLFNVHTTGRMWIVIRMVW